MNILAKFQTSTNMRAAITNEIIAIKTRNFIIVETKDGQSDFRLVNVGSRAYNYNILLYREKNGVIPGTIRFPKKTEVIGTLEELKEKINKWGEEIQKKGIRSSRGGIYNLLTHQLEVEILSKGNYLFKNYVSGEKEFSDPYESFLSLLRKQGVPDSIPESRILIISD